MFVKSLCNKQFSLVALLLALALGMTGCSEPDNPAARQAALLAEKKVASVDAGNFDKLVMKSEVPVLIWFYNSKGGFTSYFGAQHKIMEALTDHYGDAVKVVKIDHGICPQIKWTMDPSDPEPWSKYSGSGVWLLKFPDGKCARLSMVNRETGTANAPTVEQFIWFVDHARQVAPLTASSGNAPQPADK
jgi:hypothetical protein